MLERGSFAKFAKRERPVFTHTRLVHLKETDATGVIYFTALMDFALEAFEVFLQRENTSLQVLFSKGYFFPIVHAEADYKLPLRVGEEIEIALCVAEVSERSFMIRGKVLRKGEVAGVTQIIHTFLQKGEEKAKPLPKEVTDLFQKLKRPL